MSLRTFEARRFIEPARRGINHPMLIRGRASDGEDHRIYVKTRAGYGDRPFASGVELFTTMLARELGLNAPEPVLVEIPPGFEKRVFDYPRHRELLAKSAGLNFGTLAMGGDWKTWPVQMSIRAFPSDMVERILLFDAMAQHTDRASDNPNMLWRGHEIVVLDHEKCFGYLALPSGSRHGWREFFQRDGMRTHCLRHHGKALLSGTFGDAMHESLLGLSFENRFAELAREATGAFPESGMEIQRIREYLDALTNNFRDFVGYLKHSLDQ